MELGIGYIKPATVEKKAGKVVDTVRDTASRVINRSFEHVSEEPVSRPLNLEMEDILEDKIMVYNRMTGKVSYKSAHFLDTLI